MQVAQLEGRVKQLEQEVLDMRDGADEDKLLPVGKLQVHSLPSFCRSTFYLVIFRRVLNSLKID